MDIREKQKKYSKIAYSMMIIGGILFATYFITLVSVMNGGGMPKNIGTKFLIAAIGVLLINFGKMLLNKSNALKAGIAGEDHTSNILDLLPSSYHVLSNKSFEIDGRRAEIDNIILSNNGIVVVETKNYKGEISGNEGDPTWDYNKVSASGRMYHSQIKNPIKQVKRQTFLLSTLLKQNNIKCWVDYCVFIDSNQVFVNSDCLYTNERYLLDAVQNYGKPGSLNEQTIKSIKAILK